eukprot:8238183-Alexandrium_andersonii.AAC.1
MPSDGNGVRPRPGCALCSVPHCWGLGAVSPSQSSLLVVAPYRRAACWWPLLAFDGSFGPDRGLSTRAGGCGRVARGICSPALSWVVVYLLVFPKGSSLLALVHASSLSLGGHAPGRAGT